MAASFFLEWMEKHKMIVMKKIAMLLIAVVFISFGCNQNQNKKAQHQVTADNQKSVDTNAITDKFPNLTPEEHFHAIVNDTMTLREVAIINGIGEPFLKTKLGIPTNITYEYPLRQLKKNYKFTLEALKTLVEDTKNRSASLAKEREKKK